MMTTIFAKPALALTLVLWAFITFTTSASHSLPHNLLAYASRNGLSLADTDHDLSLLLVDHPSTAHTQDAISWSPDGAQIAFVATDYTRQNPDAEIYVISLADRAIRNVSQSPTTYDAWPAWSPDGKMLAFASQYTTDQGAQSDISVVDTRDWQLIPALAQSTGRDSTPFFSPDGKWLTFVSGRGSTAAIYLADTSTGALHPLVQTGTTGEVPAWSPDGQQMAFVRWEFPPDTTHPYGSNEIYLINAASQEELNLTQNVADDSWPAWSSDGRQMLFLSDKAGSPEFYLMNIADRTTSRLNLLRSANYGYSLPVEWSPDDRWLAATLTGLDGTNVYIFNLSTGKLYRITDDGSSAYPAWQP